MLNLGLSEKRIARQRPSPGPGRNRAVLTTHAALQTLFCKLKHNLSIFNNKFSVLRTLKHNIFVWSLPAPWLSLSSWCLNRMSRRNLHSIKLNCREQTQGDTIWKKLRLRKSSLKLTWRYDIGIQYHLTMIEHCWNLSKNYFPQACHDGEFCCGQTELPRVFSVSSSSSFSRRVRSLVSVARALQGPHCGWLACTAARSIGSWPIRAKGQDTSANQRPVHLQCTDICSSAPARSPQPMDCPSSRIRIVQSSRDIETKNIFCKSSQLETQSSIESSPLSRTL